MVKKVAKLLEKDPSLLDGTFGYFRHTPLMAAAAEGREDVVALLLQKGAMPDLSDADGCTALYQAAISGQPAVVTMLLEHGADAGVAAQEGWTPLMRAAHRGHVSIVMQLLKHGAR
jgi:ankyrin repeat protein